MGLLAVGTWLLTRLGPYSSLHVLAGELALAGLGVGIFLSPNNSALMGSAPRDQQGVASAVLATARNVGNVLGIGLVGAVFNSVLASHAPSHALFAAFHAGLWVVALAAVLGAFTSAARVRK